jgi:hypothetical protein
MKHLSQSKKFVASWEEQALVQRIQHISTFQMLLLLQEFNEECFDC